MKNKLKEYVSTSSAMDYDASSNMLYIYKRDVEVRESKSWRGKNEPQEDQYSNLILWDIDAQQKRLLLNPDLAAKHLILGWYYETRYQEEEKVMAYNRQLPKINDKQLPKRALKDVLLVETALYDSPEHYLWLSNKKGAHFQQIAVLEKGWKWHLDVGNEVLRILEHSPRDVNIREIPWQVPS